MNQQRKCLQCTGALLALVLLLSGCTGPGSPATAPENTTPPEDTGPITSLRTGLLNQGISTSENAFECTNDGIYVMYEYGDTFLLYADHGSDTFVKLCGRPDCGHTGADCNAYFRYCHNICYDDGYLYAVEAAGGRARLYRMNPDGTDRTEVISSDDVEDKGGYGGLFAPLVCNGVFFFYLTRVNENGDTEAEPFYYLLDGSMERPEPMDLGFPVLSDGENLLAESWAKSGIDEQFGLYRWDLATNTSTYLTDIPLDITGGYWGTETGFYLKDGVIYQQNYADGTSEALFDTGLDGYYQMSCFPDCIVISKARTQEEKLNGEKITDQILFFYDWDFQSLGQVEIDYPLNISGDYVLCGETPERILLTGHITAVPQYYIEKSDFGTGNIEIHPFNLPELPGMGDEAETDEQG